jgi:hypothetical protein
MLCAGINGSEGAEAGTAAACQAIVAKHLSQPTGDGP